MKDLKNITADDLPKFHNIKLKDLDSITALEIFIRHFIPGENVDAMWCDQLAAVLSEVAKEAARHEAIAVILFTHNYSQEKAENVYDQYLEQLKQEKK